MIKWDVLNNNINSRFDELKINSILAKVLANRNIDFNSANEIVNCLDSGLISPYKLINGEVGANLLLKAIEEDYIIYVFADYDCDGLSSGYTMTSYLMDICSNEVYVKFPDRADGYGLNMNFCKDIVNKNKNKKVLVITVDNGTSCLKEVKYLQDNNIDVLITDHHKPSGELPNCIIVNPHIDNKDDLHHLAGVGVVYKLLQILESKADIKKEYLEQYLFAVSIGTIADVMPINKDNLILIKKGIKQLNSNQCNIGLRKLKELTIGKKDKFNPNNIAWEIAPILNACGRMGQINTAARIFFEDNDDAVIEAIEVNTKRKDLTNSIKKEMKEIDWSQNIVCLYDISEHPSGIAGILAGTLAEVSRKPSFVYGGNDEIVSGSSRSVNGIDIQEFLKQQYEIGNILDFGGHSQAAGFSLLRSKIQDFETSIGDCILSYLEDADFGEYEEQETTLFIDTEIDLIDLTSNNFDAIQSIAYDKNYFTEPLFSINNLKVDKVAESSKNKENIKLTLIDKDGYKKDIWAWGFGTAYKKLGSPKLIDIAGTMDKDFMNKSNITFKVKDIRKCE